MQQPVGAAAAHPDAQDMFPAVVHLLALLLVVPPIGAGSEHSGPLPSPVTARAGSGPPLVAPAWAGSATGVWPLAPRPRVVAGFDPPLTVYGPGHRGVDLAGSPGQVVRAAAAGRVTFAGSVGGRGVVVVDHGGTRTTYEPVHASVGVGTLMRAGEPIGTLQAFGSHCWPDVCLHWGLLQGEVYLDPLTLLGAGPVRLLPLLGSAGAPTGSVAAQARPVGVPAGTPVAAGLW